MLAADYRRLLRSIAEQDKITEGDTEGRSPSRPLSAALHLLCVETPDDQRKNTTGEARARAYLPKVS
jgi:hypothetical protein